MIARIDFDPWWQNHGCQTHNLVSGQEKFECFLVTKYLVLSGLWEINHFVMNLGVPLRAKWWLCSPHNTKSWASKALKSCGSARCAHFFPVPSRSATPSQPDHGTEPGLSIHHHHRAAQGDRAGGHAPALGAAGSGSRRPVSGCGGSATRGETRAALW